QEWAVDAWGGPLLITAITKIGKRRQPSRQVGCGALPASEGVIGTGRRKGRVSASKRHVVVERFGAARFAVAAEADLLDPGFGLAEQPLAMLLQVFAALVDRDRFRQRDFAALEPGDDLLKLFERLLEAELTDRNRCSLGHFPRLLTPPSVSSHGP